ncbi:MAG: hypothetical protein HKO59_08250 [Phycisphaerales bacterium]|nr:hypothetical protein [Phycisphaerae bacterium]NNF42575.1 hypothetical protein [Phycisphaerales bacterium]NNM25962.1 hypothetical protein [Phycisphaerales bacterium]
MNHRTSIIGLLVTLTAAAAGVGSLSGCNILGPASYLIGGLPKIDAEYELVDRPTVVFVDDRANVIVASAHAMRHAIADRVSTDLMKQGVLSQENTISPRDAMGIVNNRDRHEELMPVDAIGRAVGAEQVIFIEMRLFAESTDGVTPRPTAACGVRVIDVAERVRLYPLTEDTIEPSRPVQATMPAVDPIVFRSTSSRLKVHELLAEETGAAIAKLFYRHESRELGGNLNPR